MWGVSSGVDVGIAVTAGAVTAVTRRAGGDAQAVLVNDWPTQVLDTRDESALANALMKVHSHVWSDVDSVVVTHPSSFSGEQVHRLRQTAEQAGWDQVRVVSAPVAAGIAHASANTGSTVAVADATGERTEVAVLVPQPDAAWGVVASRVRGQATQSVAAVVRAAATAADVDHAEIQRVLVVAVPPTGNNTARELTEADITGPTAVSPVELAGDGLLADDVITGGNRGPGPVRVPGAWPRPASSLACLVGSLAALAAVMSGAGSIGAKPDATVFALASLGLFTAVMGAASFAASRLISRHAGWARAGRAIVVGAGIGAAGVAAAIVIVAAHFAVPAWPLLLAGGLAVTPSVTACGVIGVGIATHPDTPPTRNLWPPVGAMAAVTVASSFITTSNLESAAVSGWELLPTRVAVGVWLFAITGLIVHTPWPRVIGGLAVGVAAGLIAGPGTVPVFAVVVIAVVSGWWLATAGLVHLDRHGRPNVTPSSWTRTASPTRTVHQP